MLLIRIMIGKTERKDRLICTLRGLPVMQGRQGWNCVSWVKEALETLQADGAVLGTSILVWGKVRDAAMDYCQKKKERHRFDGKGNFDMSKAATYDLLERKRSYHESPSICIVPIMYLVLCESMLPFILLL